MGRSIVYCPICGGSFENIFPEANEYGEEVVKTEVLGSENCLKTIGGLTEF